MPIDSATAMVADLLLLIQTKSRAAQGAPLTDFLDAPYGNEPGAGLHATSALRNLVTQHGQRQINLTDQAGGDGLCLPVWRALPAPCAPANSASNSVTVGW